jgi:hypothetical protein
MLKSLIQDPLSRNFQFFNQTAQSRFIHLIKVLSKSKSYRDEKPQLTSVSLLQVVASSQKREGDDRTHVFCVERDEE